MTETESSRPAQQAPSSWLALPTPLRRVFARFPLVTYSANELPQTAAQQHTHHVFYSFQRPQTPTEQPSCNPTCLKWQALLNFQGLEYQVQRSNNHASPSGALPFILPANTTQRPSTPVSANKIPRWIISQGGSEETLHSKEEAYSALIDHDVRNAWLYFLYLDARNFKQVAYPLYCEGASSNYFVKQALARQLQSAAEDELLKSYHLIDPHELYRHARRAFDALSTLLGENEYYFGNNKPGLFDASVFAYTHLLLDDSMKWQNTVLVDLLREHTALVAHRDRLLSQYFP